MYNGFIAPHWFGASHTRSSSADVKRSPSPFSILSKSRSTITLNRMADTEPSEGDGGTIAETNAASDSQLGARHTTSSAPRTQEDNSEVAALSEKLIRAINQQTSLDDKLAQARHELEESRRRIVQLETETKSHNEKISNGFLVPKADAERMSSRISANLEEERKQRSEAEQAKARMESEVENLTASLFDEANKMVAAANRDRDAIEKKNKQLRDQIRDGETLLASQSEQLAELKVLMQSISPEGAAEQMLSPRVSEGPTSPDMAHDDNTIARLLEAMNLSPATPQTHDILPAPSTSFTHLIKTHCRSDIPAYEDFRSLIQLSTRSNHPSRAGSGSHGGLGLMGISSLSSVTNSPASANGSTTSLNPGATSKQSQQAPPIPGAFNAAPTPISPDPMLHFKGPIPLKDTKFYKRVLVEDVEPTLRLDLSPSISWLNRRSVLNALADSSLIVEPIPEASRKLYGRYTPCALCGETRKENENPRTHRMRVNEGEGATKWSLCVLCLEKVRSVGDLVGYVRMIRDGVVKCQDPVDETEAWEELIRLRERLFWARMAGGVLPSFVPKLKSLNGSPLIKGPTTTNVAGANGGGQTAVVIVDDDDERRSSASSDENATSKSQEESARQLQAELDGPLTTFDNLKDKPLEAFRSPNATPPSTPPRKRESGGFPKISIPKVSIPETFWKGEVNVIR